MVAACNPKGSYDLSADLTANTAIAAPLLSRFDLVLLLLDQPEKEYDKRISTFLLKQALAAPPVPLPLPLPLPLHENQHQPRLISQSVIPTRSASTAAAPTSDLSLSTREWSQRDLSDYVQFVRDRLHPSLSSPASKLLQRYYQQQRQSDDRYDAKVQK